MVTMPSPPLATATPAARSRLAWRWLPVLMLLAIAVYANAWPNPFLSDDRPIIQDSPTITHPSLTAGLRLWTIHYWARVLPDGQLKLDIGDTNLYRPVVIFSYWLNSLATGVDARWFRLVNLLLHAAAAFAVGRWIAVWLGRAPGLVAAGLVLLHPVGTDVINRIVGRADILALLGIAAFLALQRSAQLDRWTWRRAFLAALAALIAVGSKESGLVLVPLALLQAALHHFAPAPPLVPLPPAHAPRHAWRGLIALLLPLLLYFTMRWAVVTPSPHYAIKPNSDLLENPLLSLSFADRLPAAAALVLHYLRTFIAPWPLIVFDNPVHPPTWASPAAWAGLGLGLALALAALAIHALLRRRFILLPIAWFFSAYFIVSHLVTPIGTYTDVRLAYPMLGALAGAVGLLTAWLMRQRPVARRGAGIGALAIAAAATLAIVVRCGDFRSEMAMVRADVRHRPDNPAALLRLGSVCFNHGMPLEALHLARRASELAPESSAVFYDLANYELHWGNIDAARSNYELSLRNNPDNFETLANLSGLEINAGNYERAESLLRRAVELEPRYLRSHVNLAVVEARTGRIREAIARLRMVLERNPADPAANRNLAGLERVRPDLAAENIPPMTMPSPTPPGR